MFLTSLRSLIFYAMEDLNMASCNIRGSGLIYRMYEKCIIRKAVYTVVSKFKHSMMSKSLKKGIYVFAVLKEERWMTLIVLMLVQRNNLTIVFSSFQDNLILSTNIFLDNVFENRFIIWPLEITRSARRI